MDLLTPSMIASVVLGLLFLLLTGAAWSDIKSHRIPNRLVFAGAGLGLLLNSVLPEGFGFMSALPGAVGFLDALIGLGLGLAVFLPLYMLRAMGAGDVKLMAMVGAFLGPNATVGAMVASCVLGGVLTVVVLLRNKTMGHLFDNLRSMSMAVLFKMAAPEMPTLNAIPVSAGKIPFGVAIATGTMTYYLLTRNIDMSFLNFFKLV